MRLLKLIWDFRGADASNIAEHHEKHLKDYIKLENLDVRMTGIEVLNDLHSITFLVVSEDKMKVIRDNLKPHRGIVHKN